MAGGRVVPRRPTLVPLERHGGVACAAAGANGRQKAKPRVPARGTAANALRMRRNQPPPVDRQGLLERCIGLGDYDGLERLLQQPVDVNTVLILAVSRNNPRTPDVLRVLLSHSSATYDGCLRMLEHVLSTAAADFQCWVAEVCIGAFPGLMGRLSKEVVTRTFQTEGVTRRHDLFHRSAGYRLAYLLLGDGAPRPPSAYFPPPRVLSEDEEACVGDPDFPPDHDIRLQLIYRRARARLNHRLRVLLYYIRKRTAPRARGAFDLLPDLLDEVASFVPYGHPSLYPSAPKRVKVD